MYHHSLKIDHTLLASLSLWPRYYLGTTSSVGLLIQPNLPTPASLETTHLRRQIRASESGIRVLRDLELQIRIDEFTINQRG